MNNYFFIDIIDNVFSFLNLLIIIRVFMSWFQISHRSLIANIIINITETLLRPVRELIFQFNSNIDFSPIITIFILNSIKSLLISIII